MFLLPYTFYINKVKKSLPVCAASLPYLGFSKQNIVLTY